MIGGDNLKTKRKIILLPSFFVIALLAFYLYSAPTALAFGVVTKQEISNETPVDTDELRMEKWNETQIALEEKLTEKVDAGKISEDEKNKILDKRAAREADRYASEKDGLLDN